MLQGFLDSTFEGDSAIINVQMLERKLDTAQIQSSSITIMRSTDVENVYANTMVSSMHVMVYIYYRFRFI